MILAVFGPPFVTLLLFITITCQGIFVPSFCFASSASGNHLFVLFQVSISVSYSIMSFISKPPPYRTPPNGTYHCIWNSYLKFCQFHELQLFPASLSTIAAFITLVSFSVKSYQTINNYLSALRCLNVFCHFDTQAFDDNHAKLTQKGLEKSMFLTTKPPLPINLVTIPSPSQPLRLRPSPFVVCL